MKMSIHFSKGPKKYRDKLNARIAVSSTPRGLQSVVLSDETVHHPKVQRGCDGLYLMAEVRRSPTFERKIVEILAMISSASRAELASSSYVFWFLSLWSK